jgi:hypothetical protein
MSFIFDAITGIIIVYLSLTTSLASLLEPYVNRDSAQLHSNPIELITLPSLHTDGEGIPRILLENSVYQKATVIDGILTPQKSASPFEALVNIFCTFSTPEYTRSTTGSGFFVNDNGVILTNAHVAQFLLLEEIISGTGECIVRTGTPAVPTYRADLLYIPPAWVQENASLLGEVSPQGTGERDYALLYVTSRIDEAPMPAVFPAIAVDTNLLTQSTLASPVRAAGYPAEVLAREGVDAPLRGIEVGTKITELMTFGSNYVDLFTIAGTNIGQQGSSGGPVADSNGNAIGLISTRGDDARFGTGSLRAISLSYIDRTITEETGFSFTQNVSGNLPYRAEIFSQTLVPFLKTMLKYGLEQEQQ